MSVAEELDGSFVGGGFLDATASEVAEFVGIDVLATFAIGAIAEGCGIEPSFAQANIGNGSARADDHAVSDGEMVQNRLPGGAIAHDVDAVTAHERKFADELPQLRDGIVTSVVVGADDGDARR